MNSEEIQPQPLSLHETTEQYGAIGLEMRFRQEVDALDFLPDTRMQIDEALGRALYAHERQTRGEHPYSTHVLRVATRIIHHFGVTDPAIIIAALLHDTVEDQPGRLIGKEPGDDIRYRAEAMALITNRFGEEVASLVHAVTNPPRDPTVDKQKQYQEHVEESLEDDPKARVIKLSDFIDNCSGLIYNENSDLAKHLAEKYLPLLPAMRRFASLPNTPLEPAARKYIIESLGRAEVRCQDLMAA